MANHAEDTFDDEPKTSKKFRFKYIVTEVYGDVPEGVMERGNFVYEDHYRGRSTDWNIYKLSTGKHVWGFAGTYVEKIPLAEFEKMRSANA